MSKGQVAGHSAWLRHHAAAAGAQIQTLLRERTCRKVQPQREREKERDREARKIDLRGKGGPWREASQSQLGRSASTSGGCGPRGGGYLLPAPPPPPTQKPELVPPGITVCPLRLTSDGGAGTPKPDTWPEPLMAFPFGSQKRKTGSDVNF